MLIKLGKLARNLAANTSGNATLIIAMGMPALIGGAGFAVDTAQYYMWKQELQHAVDQAALAGAYSLSKDKASTTYTQRALQEYDANLQITQNMASAPTIALADYAGDTNNSVIVSASISKMLPFSGMLTNQPLLLRAAAQAAFTPGKAYNACIRTIKQGGTTLSIGGNATVKAQCGLAALSCSDGAVQIADSATVETDSIATCGTADVPSELQSVVSEHVQGLTDPFGDLSTPETNGPTQNYSCNNVNKGGRKTQQANLVQGTYSSLVVKCTTSLAAGIYVIDGGVLDMSANYDVTGKGVMFVLKNGATIKLGGQGTTSNTISLSPIQAGDFEAMTPAYPSSYSKDYSGILVYEDRNNNPGSPGHVINGNATSMIEGNIYLPSGDVTVSGNSYVSSQCLQITAKTITVQGGAWLQTLCTADQTDGVGYAPGEVKLVA
ncbi:TadE/TadG family type IV pilus assembly protein [Novosphingobium sp. ZN18A2]|uniref:TadE/TadG family type IV pilus assembly protein n=1 Tax=Novosphingobium sp. ZN18A2 TaxID=3079861 RepID=UPI0030CADBFA